MTIKKEIELLIPEMEQWRHHIHQHPEIAFEEKETSDFIAKKLESFGIEVHRGLGGTGLVGVIHGKDKGASNKSVGIRADIDALPMTEKTNLPYSSRNEGRMHACGHDGHTTMLLGAAHYLAKTRNFYGTVYCIFQPAEEGGNAGAKAMIDDGLFKKFKIDSVWGIHNWPGLPVGHLVSHKGLVQAGGDIFILKITGRGGHAAQPHHNHDPMVAAGLVITSLQTIISRQLDPFDHTVISLTKIEGGSAFNVIPDVITIGGTCRTTNNETRDRMLKQIKKVASDAAAIHDCTVEMEIRPGYPPTVNNPEKAEVASNVFESTFGKEKILTDQTPSMGSEDFSYMLQERPGAYIWLGNGEDSENLHSVHYNFNDKLLPIGAHYWATLSETLLANN